MERPEDSPPKNSPSSSPEQSSTSDQELPLPLPIAEMNPGRAADQHDLEFSEKELEQKTLLGTEQPQSTEPHIFSTAGGPISSGVALWDVGSPSAVPTGMNRQTAPLQGQKTPTREIVNQPIEPFATGTLPSQSNMDKAEPGYDELKNVLMSSDYKPWSPNFQAYRIRFKEDAIDMYREQIRPYLFAEDGGDSSDPATNGPQMCASKSYDLCSSQSADTPESSMSDGSQTGAFSPPPITRKQLWDRATPEDKAQISTSPTTFSPSWWSLEETVVEAPTVPLTLRPDRHASGSAYEEILQLASDQLKEETGEDAMGKNRLST